jgi:type II secretion system protein C
MRRQDIKNKTTARIPHAFEARIVELSLQNPEYGAQRLLPLMNSDGIDVSASTVYNILKHNNLQTREKRLARLKEKIAETAAVSKKKTKRSSKKPMAEAKRKKSIVTDEVAEHIVQISLQNPNFGAQRLLPLLEKDKIRMTASAVYRLLKRNGLENRDKRLAAFEARQAVETTPPKDIRTFPPKPIAVPLAVAKPNPPQKIIKEKVSAPRPLLSIKAHEKTKFRTPWFLTLSNVLLLALLVYLGFYAAQNFRIAGMVSTALAAPATAPEGIAALPETAAPSLDDYRIIWERNLFNVSAVEAPPPKKEIVIEKLAPAKQDLGLRLVGTAVADNPRLSRAFIDNRLTGEQEAYREGDQAGEVLIKKIRRNKVIIATREGDRLLTVEIQTTAKGQSTSAAVSQRSKSSTLKSQSGASTTSSARTRSVGLDKEEIEASLADIDGLLAELDIAPYTRFGQPGGFRISNISSDSVLKKIGLSSRDVIVGINGHKITGPDQAAEFINTIAKGGQVTIRARRRLRTRRINLSIE